MDKKAFIDNLQKLFCETNLKEKRYTEVWLSEVDFGGMYSNGKYVLNVKAEHEIQNCSGEISDILDMVHEKAHEELEYIWRVDVYDSNDQFHCQSLNNDILIYAEELACR